MFTFPEQHSDEKILMVVRKHGIAYARIIAGFFVAIIIPLVIFLNIWFRYYPFSKNPNLSVAIGLIACAYILFGLLFACIKWINDQFDLFIITNQRLIDITQVTFLERTVASTPLEHIQDATSNVAGILQTLLNYGDLEVKTAAGASSTFYIDRVPDPVSTARKILDYAREIRGQKNSASSDV